MLLEPEQRVQEHELAFACRLNSKAAGPLSARTA